MINGAVKRENMENMFVMAALVAILAWYVAEIVPTRQDSPFLRFGPFVVYAVQSGDTLWEYVSSVTPEGGDVVDTVDELIRLNGLDSESLYAGQRLRAGCRIGNDECGLFSRVQAIVKICIVRFARIQTPRLSIRVSAMTAIPSAAGVNARNAPSGSPLWKLPCCWW